MFFIRRQPPSSNFQIQKGYNFHKLGYISNACKESTIMLTDATEQTNSVITDFASLHMNMFFSNLQVPQERNFILNSASTHAIITQSNFLKFYPTANLPPLEFIGMTTIHIINASGEVVHWDILLQKRGLTFLGMWAMRKLGVAISLHTCKAEPERPKAIAKTIPHANFLSLLRFRRTHIRTVTTSECRLLWPVPADCTRGFLLQVAWNLSLYESRYWLPGYQQWHPVYFKINPRLAEANRLPFLRHPQSNGLAIISSRPSSVPYYFGLI